jgi:prepilin-type N-terminal cleavage/methylation domain-containing protein
MKKQKNLGRFTPSPKNNNFRLITNKNAAGEEKCRRKNKSLVRGFTLIELLLVIGIIAALALIVIVALDPAKRFEDSKNARRLSDIQSISTALSQYIVDNRGTIPSNITQEEKQIGTAGSGCELSTDVCNIANTGDCADLSTTLGRYLREMPFDSEYGSADLTHYSVQMDSNNIITVRACESTDPETASISR